MEVTDVTEEKGAPELDVVPAEPLPTDAEIDDMFVYHQWSQEQIGAGARIRESLATFAKSLRDERAGVKPNLIVPYASAVLAVASNAPESEDRQTALKKLERALALSRPYNLWSPGPDFKTALRLVREARMDANSAITHNGKY